MTQYGPSEVAGKPDPGFLQQTRVALGDTAIPNNPLHSVPRLTLTGELVDYLGNPVVTFSPPSGPSELRGAINAQPGGYLTQQSIMPVPAWAAGTYRRGQTVQNTVNGVPYVWGVLCDPGGSLTSTAAPANIVSTKPVADPGDGASGTDTKGWVFLGPVRTNPFLSSEFVSYTSSNSAPAGLSSFAAWAANTPLGKIPLDQLDPASRFITISGTLYPDAGPKNASNTTGGASGITFITDEPDIGWRLSDASSYNDAPIFVDGYPLALAAGVLGNQNYRRLTFRNRRMRKIRITTAANPMTNWFCSSSNSMFLPAADDLSRAWLAVGDSYFGGAAPGPVDAVSTWPIRVSQELGLPIPFNSAVGGSGAVSTNGGTVYNYLQRLQADTAFHTAKNYRFALLQGSGNDVGVGTLADYTQQWVAILSLVRSFIPYGPIFVTTICNGDFGTIGNVASYNNAIRDAVSLRGIGGDTNIYVIPMSSDTPTGVPVLNPTNNSNYIGAVDRHPFDSGHIYLARYVADQIRKFVFA